MIKITENWLSDADFNLVQTTTAMGSHINWNHHKHNLDDDALCNHQFSHMVYFGGEWITDKREIFEPICDYLDAFVLIRVKVNLLPHTAAPYHAPFHIDCDRAEIAQSAILYLDDTDGPTEFETGEKVECISNRFVQFDADIKHRSWSTTNRPYRRVVNFNWIPR